MSSLPRSGAPANHDIRAMTPAHIVIVGGGLAGAATAFHALRGLRDTPARVTVIEPRPVLGAGLAYSTDNPDHRVNVAAARMWLDPDEPLAFDRWFHESGRALADPEALLPDGRAYPRRSAFGDHVDAALRREAAQHPDGSFRHIRARAEQIERRADHFRINLDNGTTLSADLVVLAPGHPLPSRPNWANTEIAAHPAYFGDPWSSDIAAKLPTNASVLIVGTGLTMADVVASLDRQQHQGTITAISRRGLLPRPRTSLPVEAYGRFDNPPAHRASRLLAHIRRVVSEAVAAGHPWECVIDALRQQGTVVWQALPLIERQRLLRHARPYWDSHRYQISPQIQAHIDVGKLTGRLRIQRARIVSAKSIDGGFAVTLLPRGATASICQEFAAIINCTGPDQSALIRDNPALQSLGESGLLQPDPLGLGLQVDLTGRAIGRNGRPVEHLFVAGPPARGTFGELMGLPQISLQAALVAREVAGAAGALVRATILPA